MPRKPRVQDCGPGGSGTPGSTPGVGVRLPAAENAIPQDRSPERVGAGWRGLVWYPDDHNLLTRRKLQLWQWQLNPHCYVLLKPRVVDGRSTRRAVWGYTRQGTVFPRRRIDHVDTDAFADELATTVMDVGYAVEQGIVTEHAQEVPNACALRYITLPSNVSLYDYMRAPLPDSAWDYTCEHPDAPGVRLPGPPALFQSGSVPPVVQHRAVTFDFDE